MRVLNKLMNEIFLLIQDNFNLSSIPTAPFFKSPAQASITQWFVFVVEITIPYRSSHQWMNWNIKKPRKIIVKETLEQVFSCEFYEISKNTFFTEHVWATAFSLNNCRPHFVVVMNFMLAILLISVLCHVKSDVTVTLCDPLCFLSRCIRWLRNNRLLLKILSLPPQGSGNCENNASMHFQK